MVRYSIKCFYFEQSILRVTDIQVERETSWSGIGQRNETGEQLRCSAPSRELDI